MDTLEKLEDLQHNFEQQDSLHPDDNSWKHGVETIETWIRLIKGLSSDEQADASLLMENVAKYRRWSIAWHDLMLRIFHWLRSSAPFQVQKVALLALFESLSKQEPNDEVWQQGLKITTEWLLLVNQDNVNREEVDSLVRNSTYWVRPDRESYTLKFIIAKWAGKTFPTAEC